MITIREDKPVKISGITSLFVSFDFKPDTFQVIKNSELAIYNKNTYTWELPVTSLAYLLDNLTYCDDIKFTILPESDRTVEYEPILTYKTTPFKHQLEAIKWGLQENHKHWLLLDAPGCGKSKVIINLAEELKAQRGIEHCLIICGINTLKSNWKKEINIHSNLSCRVIGEKISRNGTVSYASVAERAKELKNTLDAFFYIINIESLRDPNVVKAILTSKNKIDMIVIDEIHKCASSKSQQANGILKLKNYAYKIGMTGTLLVNSPLSAYLPLKWIGVEHSTLTNFKAQYCVLGGFNGKQIEGYKNLDLLKEEIDSCSLRRTKEDFSSLPPKTVINELIDMNTQHLAFYRNVAAGIKEECDKIELNASNVLGLVTRLRQASVCPSLLTSQAIPSSKIDRCLDLVEEIVSQGEKVVIMSAFKQPLYEVKKLLSEYNPLIGTGDEKDDEVSKNIDLFQTDPKYKVFLGTHSKMGTGVTLNAAAYMICLDTPWTYALQEQVEDRIHRVTNTKPVFIYRLICQGTIDESVAQILSKKKAISDFVIDDKIEDDALDILRNYLLEL